MKTPLDIFDSNNYVMWCAFSAHIVRMELWFVLVILVCLHQHKRIISPLENYR